MAATNPASAGGWKAYVPHVALAVAVIAIVLAMLAGLGSRWEWWHFRTGFSVLRWAGYLAIAGIVLSVAGLIVARPGTGRTGGFVGSLVGLVIAAIAIGYPAYLRYVVVPAVPFIHDITTDTENPPQFQAVLSLRQGADNPPAYPGPDVARQQRQGYPELGPALYDASPAEIIEEAGAVARELGWEVVAVRPGDGRLEAVDTTFWFGYKDDVVVRVTEQRGLSRVDVRSKSRVGRSDLGVNAERIRTFLDALSARMGA